MTIQTKHNHKPDGSTANPSQLKCKTCGEYYVYGEAPQTNQPEARGDELAYELKTAIEHVDHLGDEIRRATDFIEVKRLQHRLDIAKAYASALQRGQHYVALAQAHIDAECKRARLTERIERLQELIDYANSHFPLMADDIMLSRLYTAKGQLAELSPTAESGEE
jgi:ABC-type phosphate transport system auxiliary subunit